MADFYWKVFDKEIIGLVKEGKIGFEFLIIPVLLCLFIMTSFFISKGYIKARRFIQCLSFLILGIIFLQCLCISKDTTIGIKNLFFGEFTQAFANLWFPFTILLFVFFFGRKIYCFWICPLGFVQDLTGKANIYKKKRNLGFIISIILTISMGLAILLTLPSIFEVGALLGFFTFIVLLLTIIYPAKEFSKLKYLILLFWIILAIFVKIPGPWCVIGKANLKYSAIISFLCVILASIIIPRIWCKYICPDGGLFQLIGKRKKDEEKEANLLD
ncbi:TPA: hypothetical protein DCX16_04235 [bacterium]|nr:hypothetical protein [bacterium]